MRHLKATCHTYVSLYYGETHVHTFDNDCEYAQDIIAAIEKRTRQKITEIKNKSLVSDYDGFHFLGLGFRNLLTQKAH